MQNLDNRTALVTGGASGIGLGIAHAMLRANMNVVLLDARWPALESVVDALGYPDRLMAIKLDVRDRDAWRDALDRAIAKFGNVHVLVGNAGIFSSVPISRATFDEWDLISAVNIDGVVNGVLSVLPHMRSHGEGGHLLATSSTSGLAAVAGGSFYSATKFSVCGFMEAVASDLIDTEIDVSVIVPGPVATHLADTSDELAGKVRAIHQPDPVGHPESLPQLSPREVGERVVAGMRRKDLYIVTHPEFRETFDVRAKAIDRSLAVGADNVALLDALRHHHRSLFRNPIYARQRVVPAFVPTET